MGFWDVWIGIDVFYWVDDYVLGFVEVFYVFGVVGWVDYVDGFIYWDGLIGVGWFIDVVVDVEFIDF